MFKEIQLTLYDIFGFLLPGAGILLAIALLFLTIFWPGSHLVLPSSLPVLPIAIIVFAAYLTGHLGQAVGNLLEKVSKERSKLDAEIPLSDELRREVVDAVAARFGEFAKNLQSREIYDLCDQALMHCQSLGEREIFTYREGFYRGNAVALSLSSLAITLRLVWGPVAIELFGRTVQVGRGPLALTLAFVSFGAWLSYRRYLRFAVLRFKSCFLRFLALSRGIPKELGQAE